MDLALGVVFMVVGILDFTGRISGSVALVLGIFAVVFVLTSAISFCPLSLPFKINTAGK